MFKSIFYFSLHMVCQRLAANRPGLLQGVDIISRSARNRFPIVNIKLKLTAKSQKNIRLPELNTAMQAAYVSTSSPTGINTNVRRRRFFWLFSKTKGDMDRNPVPYLIQYPMKNRYKSTWLYIVIITLCNNNVAKFTLVILCKYQ